MAKLATLMAAVEATEMSAHVATAEAAKVAAATMTTAETATAPASQRGSRERSTAERNRRCQNNHGYRLTHHNKLLCRKTAAPRVGDLIVAPTQY
jgi:hypothetical protein